MIRPVILVLSLATLLVCISAIPKLIDNNEHVASLYQKKSAQDVQVGAWWDHQGVHNLTVGYKSYQDSLLLQQYVHKPYKFFRIVEEDVKYPTIDTTPFIISLVEAYDQHQDSSDAGYARIIAGGVGNQNVTVRLESKRNHGLKYLIRVWGHRTY